MNTWRAYTRRLIAAVAIALLWSVVVSGGYGSVESGVAWAQSDEDIESARALLADGDRLIERGERQQRRRRERRARVSYERALERYQRAYDLVPKATIFYAIAGAEEKLGRYLDAVEHFQRVVSEVDDADLRERASERIEQLLPRIASIALTVEPAGAEISVDRRLVGQAPLSRPIYLAPGNHVITITANGYTPYEANITVGTGDHEQRDVELVEVPIRVMRPKPAEEARDPEPVVNDVAPRPPNAPRPPSKMPLFLGTSATIAVATGATVFGFLALSESRDLDTAIQDIGRQRQSQRRGRAYALASDVLSASAVVIGGYTLYRYLFVYRPRVRAYERALIEPDPQVGRAKWDIRPFGGPHRAGVVVEGRF